LFVLAFDNQISPQYKDAHKENSKMDKKTDADFHQPLITWPDRARILEKIARLMMLECMEYGGSIKSPRVLSDNPMGKMPL